MNPKFKIQSWNVFPRHNGCRGLRLRLGRSWQLEFWCCPRGETVLVHHHEKIDSHILCLWGRMRWQIAHGANYKTRFTWGPLRTNSQNSVSLAYANIPAKIAHGFTALSRSLFINLETVKHQTSNFKLTSAADDFTPVQN